MAVIRGSLLLNGGDPINRGLLGWWTHSEAGGAQVRDLSPYRRNGTNLLTRRTGVVGRHAVYAGTGTQVVNGRILSGLANWSIVARFRNTMVNNSGGHAIYAERAASGNDILKLDFGSGSAPNGAEVVIRNTAGTLLLGTPSTTAVNDGQWHTVIATLNGTAVSLYTDGRLESTSTWSGGNTFTNTGVASTIGYDLGDVNANYTGDMSHVRVLARALSPGEVRRISREPWAGTQRPLLRDGVTLVSVSLTGIAITSSAGTLTEGISVAATGSAATGSAGAPTSSLGASLAGSAATATAGTSTSAIGMSVTGEAITVSAGSLAYTIGFLLTGSASAASGGTLGTTGGDTLTTRSLTGISMTALPGNIRVTGGTPWSPQAPRVSTIATAAGNTLPPPPRLTGDAAADTRAMNQWLGTFYDQFVKAKNVLGRIDDHETRIAALEADSDT